MADLKLGTVDDERDVIQEAVTTPVPEQIKRDAITIAFNTGRVLREFLRSIGWHNPEICEFNKVVNFTFQAAQGGDYATTLERFEILKNNLRRILADPHEEAAISSGKAVGIDKIQTLLRLDLEPFCDWILHQHKDRAELPSVEPPAEVTIARITKDSMGGAISALTHLPLRQAASQSQNVGKG